MICNKSNYFQGHFIAVNPVHQNLCITKKQMLCDQVLLIVSVCLFFFSFDECMGKWIVNMTVAIYEN